METACILISWYSISYFTFIFEINKLGKEYKERIYREFLEIEPLQNFDQALLK